MTVSAVPDVCTLVWPFLGDQEGASGEDIWLIGWNPRGLVVVVVTIVQSAAIEDAQQTLEQIRRHAEGGSGGASSRSSSEHRGPQRRDVPSSASLSVLGRLRSPQATPRVSSDSVSERADVWVRNERQLSDIWLELNRGPLLNQVWCCGYHVLPCHLHVIRTDPHVRYSATPTAFSVTARFGCCGIAALQQGAVPLCTLGSHSTLEGVLLPPHMIALAGPCTRVEEEFDGQSQTRSFIRRVKEDTWDSNASIDDIPSNNDGSLTRRDRDKVEQVGLMLELEEHDSPSPLLSSPLMELPPRLDFPTSVDCAELSLLLRANNCGRALRESVENCGKESGNSNSKKSGEYTSSKRSSWENHLQTFISMIMKMLLFTLVVLTWLGKLSCTAALLEFRLREIINWLALLQGRTRVCGLHPVLPHMQHEDPSFQRFCAVNFLSRLVVDGLLGTLVSLLLAIGGNALIDKSGSFCRYFLYDLHMGYMDWFEGWPAGLKMNEDLNMTLCFFAKLVLTTRLDFLVNFNWVELVYRLLVYTAPFGASCAFALVSDICVLVSLHLLLLFYVIMGPYRVMRSMMGSLFLQFRGKKYNPLRRRIDAYDFDVDQMLMGTLLFTVTVFLFPTLAVYYLYFALVRTSIWLVQEGLITTAHLTLYLPVFPVIYWAMYRWQWPGGVAITAPKLTRARHHSNAASSSARASTTVEVTVLSKPLELRILLSDFLLVLNNLAKLRPFHMMMVIYHAQVWESTNPVERLIPHLQKDCIHASVQVRPPPATAAGTATATAATATTPASTAATGAPPPRSR
ncbi:DNA-directed RNA polymerase II subunit 3 [Trypanosoma grayi]|uniref:DNA-directed RNA polymerase II subunit 3 n=1 Tax=Trypanosoma grayi TaxID=71804 RepID=UPI0004F4303F|nr:DNA-directed RNA polymerase II subunit 3 [Trypanosoma grayi]KEG11750.1 DNA-directed RNA polymerase II subunit 3 [Trypanosoma grayi]